MAAVRATVGDAAGVRRHMITSPMHVLNPTPEPRAQFSQCSLSHVGLPPGILAQLRDTLNQVDHVSSGDATQPPTSSGAATPRHLDLQHDRTSRPPPRGAFSTHAMASSGHASSATRFQLHISPGSSINPGPALVGARKNGASRRMRGAHSFEAIAIGLARGHGLARLVGQGEYCMLV